MAKEKYTIFIPKKVTEADLPTTDLLGSLYQGETIINTDNNIIYVSDRDAGATDSVILPIALFNQVHQVSADTTLSNIHGFVEVTANTITLTLPTAVGIKGRIYKIKNSGTGVVTIACNGTETIDGATTQTLNQWDSITIISNGTNWLII